MDAQQIGIGDQVRMTRRPYFKGTVKAVQFQIFGNGGRQIPVRLAFQALGLGVGPLAAGNRPGKDRGR